MNIFRELEGTRQETMATAGLRYLMLTSRFVRETVLDFLSDKSPAGPLYSDVRFGAHAEARTQANDFSSESADPLRGRIDLLIETDDAVIGIENKFHAPFQEQQPAKYAVSLDSWRAAMETRYRVSARALLFVLAPSRRKEDVQRKISAAQAALQVDGNPLSVHLAFVSWEDLIGRLDAGLNGNRPENDLRMIIEDYTRFVRSNVAFLPDFKRMIPHWNRSFKHTGPRWEHWKLLDTLRGDMFPSASNLSGNRKRPYLYYGFAPWKEGDWGDGRWAWLGFIDADELQKENGAALVIALGRKVASSFNGSTVGLRPMQFASDPQHWRTANGLWEIPLSGEWAQPERWRAVSEKLENLFPDSSEVAE